MVRRAWVGAALIGLFTVGCSSGPSQSSVCQGVDCGKGHCVLDGKAPACLCDEGQVAKGLNCVPDTAFDPCATNPCRVMNRTVCVSNGSVAACACDDGFVEADGGCQKQSACDPNPCTGEHQTACVDQAGTAVCGCDVGYASADDGGCSVDPVFDCSAQHTDPNDTAEPDECPSLASSVPADGGVVLGREISPAGDVDWVSFAGLAHHVYAAHGSGMNLALSIDVYDTDGVTLLGSDRLGTNHPNAYVAVPADGRYYLRIRGFRTSDVGSYLLTLDDVGVDDFPNTVIGATPAQIGASMIGAIQYPADQDVVTLTLGVGHAYRLAPVAPLGTLEAELIGPDLTTVLQTNIGGAITTRPRVAGSYFFRVSGVAGAMPAYTIGFSDFGVDDVGDSPAEATPINPSSNPIDFNLERPGDLDVFSFSATAPHVYRVSTPSTLVIAATIVDSNGVIQSQGILTPSAYGPQVVSFVPPVSGTYYLELAAGQQNPGGPNSVVLADIGVDDHGNDIAHAFPITVGAPQAGQIEQPGDLDFYSLATTPGHIYQLECHPLDPNSTGSCYGAFYDAAGTAIGTYGTVLAPGTSLFLGIGSALGWYGFTVTDIGVDDIGDTVLTATTLAPMANPAAAALQYAGDVDVFRFDATASHIYRFTCSGSGCALTLLDQSGASLASSTSSPAVIAYLATSAEPLFVQVSAGPFGTAVGGYTYQLIDLGVDDVGNDLAHTELLALSTPGAGAIQYPGDVDVFTFPGTAGHVYGITVTTPYYYAVTSPSGGSLVTGYGTTPVLAPIDGVYAVAVSATDASLGAYAIQVDDRGVDDCGNSDATATPIAMPTNPALGQIEYFGDVDVYAFASVPGELYTVTCTGNTLSYCSLTAHDQSGHPLFGDESTSGSLTVEAATATTFIDVSAPFAIGSYDYGVVDFGHDDHGNSPAFATPLALNAGISAQIDYLGDVDFFSVQLSPGLHGAGAGGGTVKLTILDSTGTSSLGSGNGAVSFTVVTAGTYYVEVTQSGSLATYQLTVQ